MRLRTNQLLEYSTVVVTLRIFGTKITNCGLILPTLSAGIVDIGSPGVGPYHARLKIRKASPEVAPTDDYSNILAD